jgi:TolA-binding protein
VTAGLHGQYPPQPQHQLPSYGPQSGEKRKASVTSSLPSAADLEEQSRMAAEEDKRRRNTAASARFRIKKKQREQALEKQAKEMTDKVTQLEGKVQQLEMENKWLKGLIVDKNDGKALEPMPKENETERKADEKTDGVGTYEDDDVKAEA